MVYNYLQSYRDKGRMMNRVVQATLSAFTFNKRGQTENELLPSDASVASAATSLFGYLLETYDGDQLSGPADLRLQSSSISDEMELQRLSFEEICIQKGYHVEDHSVVTPDGYILKLHRVSKPTADSGPFSE